MPRHSSLKHIYIQFYGDFSRTVLLLPSALCIITSWKEILGVHSLLGQKGSIVVKLCKRFSSSANIDRACSRTK